MPEVTRVPDSIVEQEIVIGQSNRKARKVFWIAAIIVLIAITQPIHTWLHAHLQFLAGVLVGSVLEAIVWGAWLRRRGARP